MLNSGGGAGWWRVKPGDEIRLVKENLSFALTLWQSTAAGRLPASTLLRISSDLLHAGGPGSLQRRSDSELAADFSRGAANQMRAAFALSALQARRSLEDAFPGEPIREEWPELRAARCSLHLIGKAVERSILQPVWECPPSYRRVFHIRRLSFTLNATGLEGRALSWDDFGGLDRYMSLLEYCASSANAAFASGTSRTLPKHSPATNADFGGVIGAPGSLADDAEETPVVRPPRGFPGDRPERRLAPDAPPFVPPRIPAQPAEEEDSWDTLFEEHSGRWHIRSSNGSPSAPPADSPRVPDSPGATPAAPRVGNMVKRFVDERCETGDDRRMLAGELYEGFVGWCHDRDQEPVSQRAFGLRLSGMGFRRKRRGHGKHWWEGLRLAQMAA